jgi:ribosome biogenesis protein ERB1
MGLLPNELQDPYPDTVEYFTSIEEKMRKDNANPPRTPSKS